MCFFLNIILTNYLLYLVRKSNLISYPKSDSAYTIPVGEDIEKFRKR